MWINKKRNLFIIRSWNKGSVLLSPYARQFLIQWADWKRLFSRHDAHENTKRKVIASVLEAADASKELFVSWFEGKIVPRWDTDPSISHGVQHFRRIGCDADKNTGLDNKNTRETSGPTDVFLPIRRSVGAFFWRRIGPAHLFSLSGLLISFAPCMLKFHERVWQPQFLLDQGTYSFRPRV